MDNSQIKNLINHQKINHTLDQAFYIDENIFELDMSNICMYSPLIFLS